MNIQKRSSRMRKGFTIVELILVIVVLGLLAGVLYKSIPTLGTRANSAALANQLVQVQQAMVKYYADTGTYPCNISFLWRNPKNVVGADGAVGDKTSENCYDAVSIMAGSDQDKDVLSHWSGPYLDGAQSIPGQGNEHLLKASYGQAITIGANITGDAVTPIKKTDTVTGGNAFLNVVVVTGLKSDDIATVYKQINGVGVVGARNAANVGSTNAPQNGSYTDALDVATGQNKNLAGVSKFAANAPSYLIFRFADDFSGR